MNFESTKLSVECFYDGKYAWKPQKTNAGSAVHLVSAKYCILIMGFQIIAWSQMTHTLAKEASIIQAVKLATSGKKGCDLCNFVNDNNPMEEGHNKKLLFFDTYLIYFGFVSQGLADLLRRPTVFNLDPVQNIFFSEGDVELPPPRCLV